MKVLQMAAASSEKKALPRAVIFDLDGTLVDSAPDLAKALNHCLERDGHAPFEVSQMRQLVGRGSGALLRRGYEIREGAPLSDARLETLRAQFLAFYSAHIADLSSPFPGVEDALQALKDNQVAIGVCTNKPHAMATQLITHLHWDHYFGSVIGGDRLGVKKPDAGHIFAVCKELGAAPEDCIFIGDSEVDYEAACNANMPIIVASFGYRTVALSDMPRAILMDHYSDFLGLAAQAHDNFAR